MGLEYLDLVFQVERQLGVKMKPADFPAEAWTVRGAMTAGVMADAVLKKINSQRMARGESEIEDIWPKMQELIAGPVGLQVEDVKQESRLVEDLGYG